MSASDVVGRICLIRGVHAALGMRMAVLLNNARTKACRRWRSGAPANPPTVVRLLVEVDHPYFVGASPSARMAAPLCQRGHGPVRNGLGCRVQSLQRIPPGATSSTTGPEFMSRVRCILLILERLVEGFHVASVTNNENLWAVQKAPPAGSKESKVQV